MLIMERLCCRPGCLWHTQKPLHTSAAAGVSSASDATGASSASSASTASSACEEKGHVRRRLCAATACTQHWSAPLRRRSGSATGTAPYLSAQLLLQAACRLPAALPADLRWPRRSPAEGHLRSTGANVCQEQIVAGSATQARRHAFSACPCLSRGAATCCEAGRELLLTAGSTAAWRAAHRRHVAMLTQLQWCLWWTKLSTTQILDVADCAPITFALCCAGELSHQLLLQGFRPTERGNRWNLPGGKVLVQHHFQRVAVCRIVSEGIRQHS